MVDKTYGVIEKGPGLRIEVKSSEYNGKEVLHIREHYLTEDGATTVGEWLPTKKGVTLSEGIQIEDLIKLLEQAKEDF